LATPLDTQLPYGITQTDGIANILYLHRVKKHCRVQYDSVNELAAFHVTKPDGSVRDFRPSVSGLHYFDTLGNATVLVKRVAEDTLENEDTLHNANYVNQDPEPYSAGGVEDYNDSVDDTGSVGGWMFTVTVPTIQAVSPKTVPTTQAASQAPIPNDEDTEDGGVDGTPGGVAQGVINSSGEDFVPADDKNS
jgi:hypothetical protein